MKKPNFFIIGAPKCGTTSLAEWLAEHPNVYMSPWKEPRYFSRDLKTRFRITDREYLELFQGATEQHLAVGEATVWYLYSREAVSNIEREIPGARYIVLVRNPVDMAYSLHEEMTLHGMENILDFEKAWELSVHRREGRMVRRWFAEPRLLDYQSVCLLGEQLERLLSIVPRERVLVLVLDDIAMNPRQQYQRVLRFLGIPYAGRVTFPIHNPAKRVRSRLFERIIFTALKIERKIKGLIGLPPVQSKFLWNLREINREPAPRPPMTSDMRRRLVAYFAPDVQKMERILERDLSGWLSA